MGGITSIAMALMIQPIIPPVDPDLAGTRDPADGHTFRLVSEAKRIHLAYLFDPLLAVHTSLVQPLPHQITAVYECMLPCQPLRFLLADDPGAGKMVLERTARTGSKFWLSGGKKIMAAALW